MHSRHRQKACSMLSPMMPITHRTMKMKMKHTLVLNLMTLVKKMMMGKIWLPKNVIQGNCQETALPMAV